VALERSISVALSEKQLRLSLHFEEGTVSGDWELLLSLFGNLADNARKACRPGGKIAVTGQSLPDGSYQVCVADNGCGMPKEEIDKITEAFYRIDKSRSRREGGVGLGLAICEKIVAALGATWNIESRQGEGTQITVVFPPKEEDNEDTD
jgi:signal transduction histidine kinase